MAYRLRVDEPVGRGLKRIVDEQLSDAVQALSGSTPSSTAVHDARKAIKKVRAVLRLARPVLGGTFDDYRSVLRPIARYLSGRRDADVLVETVDHLLTRHAGALAHVDRRAICELVTAASPQTRFRRRWQVVQATADLAALHRDPPRWRFDGRGFGAIRPGLEDTLADARRAMHVVAASRRSDDGHEWRKLVKAHWYHVRVLGKLEPDIIEPYVKQLEELETRLGDDHNLVVLCQRLRQQYAAPSSRAGVADVVRVAELEEARLRGEALAIGAAVFHERAGSTVRRLKVLWRRWRAGAGPEPASGASWSMSTA